MSFTKKKWNWKDNNLEGQNGTWSYMILKPIIFLFVYFYKYKNGIKPGTATNEQKGRIRKNRTVLDIETILFSTTGIPLPITIITKLGKTDWYMILISFCFHNKNNWGRQNGTWYWCHSVFCSFMIWKQRMASKQWSILLTINRWKVREKHDRFIFGFWR